MKNYASYMTKQSLLKAHITLYPTLRYFKYTVFSIQYSRSLCEVKTICNLNMDNLNTNKLL